MPLVPCKRCRRLFRSRPNARCGGCISKNPTIYPNLNKLEAFRVGEAERLAARKSIKWAKSLKRPTSDYDRFGCGFGTLSKEDRARYKQMMARYLENARKKGKDVSTKAKRAPYHLAALSWLKTRNTPEQRHIWAMRCRRFRAQYRYMRRVLTAKEQEAEREAVWREEAKLKQRPMSQTFDRPKVKNTLVGV